MNNVEKGQRHPFKNFLVKKDFQLRIIYKIIALVTFTAVVTTIIVACVYYTKSKSGYFYFMSNNMLENMQRQNILSVIIPALIIAEIFAVIIGIIVSLYSSRKIAVPIYKIEKWAEALKSKDLTVKIIFREKDEMVSLTTKCNEAIEQLNKDFIKMEVIANSLMGLEGNREAVKLKELIEKYKTFV